MGIHIDPIYLFDSDSSANEIPSTTFLKEQTNNIWRDFELNGQGFFLV
jgi:hypothetical protein